MSQETTMWTRRELVKGTVGAALLAPLAAAWLAGCGGSEQSQGTAPAPAPPQQPIPQVKQPAPAAPAAPSEPAPAAPSEPAPAPEPAAAAPAGDPETLLVTEVPAMAAVVTSLKYVNKSDVAGQECSGCQFYTEKGGGKGKCTLFPQGLVAAAGHCTSWVKKVG